VTLSGTGSKRSPVPPAEMPRHVPAGYPDSMVTGVSSRHHHTCQFAFAISCRRSSAKEPELLSPSYRNRVRKLSPGNQNRGVKHLPGSHTGTRPQAHHGPECQTQT
jgi:hypothetical protein